MAPPIVSRPQSSTLTASRICFRADAPAGAKVRREFQQPRRMLAVEEAVEPADLPAGKAGSDLLDHCSVVFVAAAGKWEEHAETWLAPPNGPEPLPAVSVERKGVTVRWRPGRALVQGPTACREDVLAALTDFAFYEGELRTLEAAVEAREPQAQADVPLAHKVRQRDRKHWTRIRETIELCSQLRLTYARLEPRLAKGSRSLSLEARRLMGRLLRQADVEARLEAVSERLEALEDLYEGANDRIADFRWYRNGHLLEIGIIVLLLIEGAIMTNEMYLHYLDRQESRAVEMAEEKSVSQRDNSEEFRAIVTKVADGKVTFVRTPRDLTKAEKTDEQTLPVSEKLQVSKGRLDRDSREVESGESIDGGLNNEMFLKIGDKGIRTIMVTDFSNKKIAEIYVFPAATGRKGQ